MKKSLAEWMNDYANIMEDCGLKEAEKFANKTILVTDSTEEKK